MEKVSAFACAICASGGVLLNLHLLDCLSQKWDLQTLENTLSRCRDHLVTLAGCSRPFTSTTCRSREWSRKEREEIGATHTINTRTLGGRETTVVGHRSDAINDTSGPVGDCRHAVMR
jgi:hypothetical protein